MTFTTIGLRSSAVLGEHNGMTVFGRGTVGRRHAFGDIGSVGFDCVAHEAPRVPAPLPSTFKAMVWPP